MLEMNIGNGKFKLIEKDTRDIPKDSLNRRRYRGFCSTCDIWVGPERDNYNDAYIDCEIHVSKNPSHICNIATAS